MASRDKKLILIPVGGLGNRIYALCSAISFSMHYNLRLDVYWFKDWGMGANFHDIFSLNSSLHSFVRIVDAKPCNYIYDRPRKRNLWLTKPFHSLMFDYYCNEKNVPSFSLDKLVEWAQKGTKDAYLVQYTTFFGEKNISDFISPNSFIIDEVGRRLSYFQDSKKIGLHIRRSDNLYSIKNSPLSSFINYVEHEIKQNADAKFYLATDDEAVKSDLLMKYGDRLSFSSEKAVRDKSDGIVEAVVEMYLLSEMDIIYGSFGSTFSMAAADIGRKKFIVVTSDVKL